MANGFRNSSSDVSPGAVGAPCVGIRIILHLHSEGRLRLACVALVVVGDLDVLRADVCSAKAHAIVRVDTNAVLALPISPHGFQLIAPWNSKVGKPG
jgi:hypothetical protein